MMNMPRIFQTLILFFCVNFLSAQSSPKENSQNKSTITSLDSCTNWLYLPTQPAAVEIGQLNIPGNQITVEALINRTTPYTGGILYAGDVVSKHSTPSDANYLLRPNEAEITTSDGYFRTPDICEIELNKTYHVAMVYDGATLKFYRNGFLMSQIAATGDLYQNTWPTRIGYYFSEIYNTNFIGYINEVRIWNVVRTQSQIQTYMSTSLPNPTTQPGLLAYYQFSDLSNKQGNPAWNGAIVGSAVPDQSNPTCPGFVADSCCPVLSGLLSGNPICKGSPVSLTFNALNGTAPFTLTYSDGINNYTQENVENNVPFLIPNQPNINTTYTLLTIQDASTCQATSPAGVTAAVIVYPLPEAQLSGSNICAGDSAKLLFTSVAGAAPFSILYTNGINNYTLANLSSDTTFIVSYSLADTTIFKLVTITDANGCVDSANTNTVINVYPLPQGGISGSTSCSGDSVKITFIATSGNLPFELNISEGTGNTSYSGIQSGIPFEIAPLFSNANISLVSIIDNTGCIRTNGFLSSFADIVVNPSPQLQFDSLKSACMNDPVFPITQAKEISGIGGVGVFTGQGVDSTGIFSPTLAGQGVHEITYTYTANDGCIATNEQTILVNKNPIANAGADLIACENASFRLNATGGESYLWSPPDGLSNPSIPNPVVTISSSTLYTVTVTDSDGCSASDSVFVTVSPVGKNLYVVPNAFTPNGDGKNDCFGIQRWGAINLLGFSVYNRFGQLIFFTKNPSDCWNGTFHGNQQDTGTYVYIIHAQTPCGEVDLKGTVVLIR
jgi:gliding motility-associated-like protein